MVTELQQGRSMLRPCLPSRKHTPQPFADLSKRSAKGAPGRRVTAPVVWSLLYPGSADVLVVSDPDAYTRCCVAVCAKTARHDRSNHAAASAAQTKNIRESALTTRLKIAMNHCLRPIKRQLLGSEREPGILANHRGEQESFNKYYRLPVRTLNRSR
jgi:hypothetical protein